MPIYQTQFIKHTIVARNTMVCEFEKPEGFQFKPGQYGTFVLPEACNIDLKNLSRQFSLLSSLDNKTINIVTRINPKSTYKQALQNLSSGEVIKLIAPIGDFTLHESHEIPAVFIAGGVGIAPFYSILSDLNRQTIHPSIYLFYTCQSVNDMPFFNELKQSSKESAKITFVPILSENQSINWDGEFGHVSESILQKYIANIYEPCYYICGSPTMVISMKKILENMNVSEDHIKVEDFPGY